MFKVFLILDLYTSSNSLQDMLTNRPAHAHTADSPRYLPLAKDVSCLGRGEGGTWDNFCWVYTAASQSPYPILVYSVANYRPHLSHFWANMQFSLSQLSHFLLLWIDPFFLDWMKNSLLFICSTNILVRLLTVNMKSCLTPKNPKFVTPF